tara:strand:- start:50328 stop:51308 length:981 start_codon:yes stop_codon:yes gene_type:complete
MKIVIIGSGDIALRHGLNIKKIIPKADIYLLTEKARFSNQKKKIFSFVSEFLFNENDSLDLSPDAVIICSPSTKHLQQASVYASRGIALFIEKPLAHSLDELDMLKELIIENKTITMIGYVLRFNKSLNALKKFISNKGIGRISSIRSRASSYLPLWRPNVNYSESVSSNEHLGGGVVLELSHEIDYLRWIFGEPEVLFSYCDRLSLLDINVEDYAFYLMNFKDKSGKGAICELTIDFFSPKTIRQCEVIYDKGIIVWDGVSNTLKHRAFKSKNETIIYQGNKSDNDSMYLDEMTHFLDCIDKNIEPKINIYEAAKTLELSLTAKK